MTRSQRLLFVLSGIRQDRTAIILLPPRCVFLVSTSSPGYFMRPPISRIPANLTHPSRSLLFQRSSTGSFPKFKPQSRWNSSSSSESTPPLRPEKPPSDGRKTQQDGYEAPSVVQQPLNLPTGVSDGSALLASANPLLGATFTTVIGLAVVFVGGVFYFEWYKANVIRKVWIM